MTRKNKHLDNLVSAALQCAEKAQEYLRCEQEKMVLLQEAENEMKIGNYTKYQNLRHKVDILTLTNIFNFSYEFETLVIAAEKYRTATLRRKKQWK
jgi:hypothetical protein